MSLNKNEILELRYSLSDLLTKQLEIFRKYKNRPTKNVHLHDIEYQKIGNKIIALAGLVNQHVLDLDIKTNKYSLNILKSCEDRLYGIRNALTDKLVSYSIKTSIYFVQVKRLDRLLIFCDDNIQLLKRKLELVKLQEDINNSLLQDM